MAKRLLLDILVKVLGEYIELDAGNFNLDMAVWSGHIALKNLKLRPHKIFRDLGLSIVFGEIKSLEVTIPWTSLLSSPVKVVIDGISLQVGPLSYDQLDKKEIREQQIAAKLEQLRIANESIDFTGVVADVKGLDLADKSKKGVATSPNAKATYVQQWTAKIIDNIEITLKNVHFRYEDSQTIPGSIFAAGVTLKSFTLSSCDEKWTEKFVERDLNKAAKVIRKLAKVNNLGFYWMTKSNMLGGKDFVDWSKEMRLLIYSGTSLDGTFFNDVQYLLHPENSLIMKLVHDDSDKCAPKFNISVESSNFLLNIDRSQYLQVQRTLETISFAEKSRKPVIDRPMARPNTPKSCRIWWKYACKLALKRQRYIRLMKLSHTVDVGGHMDIRSEAEKKETHDLEIWIPLRSLVIFRHACAKEMHTEAADRHAKLMRESVASGLTPPVLKVVKPEPRTWVSWMSGRQKSDLKEKGDVPEEGDVSLESLIASVEQSVGDVGQASPVYDLSVTTSATLNLSVSGSPVVTATMAVTLQAASSSSGITATVHMRDLLVIDKCSSTPIISNIIAVKNKKKSPTVINAQSTSPKNIPIQDPTPSFSVTYENLNSKKVIRVTALPVEFTMNKDCIQKLIGFALPSPAAPSAPYKKLVEDILLEGSVLTDSVLVKSDRGDSTEKSLFRDVMSLTLVDEVVASGEDDGNDGQFEIIFEAHAPKIIIPQDSSSDQGFFLLDTGYLAVKGFMGPKGMTLNVSLRDINIAMPRTLADMNTFEQTSLYLIKPFNLGLAVQTVDTKAANMTVDVSIEPGMRGELDPSKLSRLLQLIPTVSATFSQENCLAAVTAADIAVYGSLLPREGPRIDLVIPDIVSGMVRAKRQKDIDDNKDSEALAGERSAMNAISTAAVNMLVTIKIPEVALDLTYDLVKSRNLVLAVTTLEMQVILRQADMQVLFDLSELSIQDSLRSETQRDLARTPRGEKRLIHISYTTISSALSPLYKQHAAEVIVEFATLALNVDVKTLLNMRPFMEVLLQRPPPARTQTGESFLIASSGASPAAPVKKAPALKGMHVVFTVNTVSLDLLQASTADAEGVVLPEAFSLKITDIRADIDMLDLMKADVKLRSLDVSDVRSASSHHVFKTIMCPVMDMDQSLASWRAEALVSESSESDRLVGEKKQPDLLHVLYTQSSTELSAVEVTLLNITAFVSMDTVMDLINVSLANANAVMSLLAAPAAATAQVSAATAALCAGDTQKSVDSTSSKAASAQGSVKGNNPTPSLDLKESCNTMNVAVKIINPNLILIDDPTTDKSRAISASCGVDVHYNNVRRLLPSINILTNMQNCEVVESLHVSVRNTRVSVLLSMLTRQPQSILEPMSFEVNLRKTSMDNILLASVMSLEVDNVKMRVSTKDIALAQSIMTRRVLFEPSAPPRDIPIPIPDTGPVEDKAEEAEVQTFYPSSALSVNMGSFSLVGINDFKGQNVPVVRFTLDDTNYHSESKENISSGEGSLKASAEFYNPQLSLWEPILDRWHPSLSLVTWPLGTVVEITSEATMQLTVSGIMLEKLMQTYSLLFEDDTTAQREEVPGILICNSLGPDIAFDVYDGARAKKLMSLENAQVKPVPVPQSSSQSNVRQLLSIADIQFTGEFGAVRDTLRQLPFNLNRPKICNLHVIDIPDEKTPAEKFAPTPVLEPIVEEVYENARYDLLRWRQPYLSNDPHHWTDGSGTVRRDIETIAINGDKWEWEGEWAVDMEVMKGEEIDRDGWEYGTNFTSFSISNKRRNHSSLDCVRRRRWLRTRVPVAGSVDERLRPLTVFWDVQTLQSGAKRVEVRSGLQIRNAMPFAVMVSLGGSGWTRDEEHGPFAESEIFNVPLRQASATWIRIRLADFPYMWSQQVACGSQSHDYHSIRDVQCEGVGGEEMGYSPVCLRVLCTQENKSLMVTVSPVVLIINKLPCDLRYICNTSSRKMDEGCLLPGTTCKLANVNSSSSPEISFTMGGLMWSVPVPIDSQKVDPVKLDILNSDGLLGMILMVATCVAPTGTMEVSVYSKGVVFDRTGGTGISLGVRRVQNPKCEMARHTFKTTQSLVCSSPFITHSQRQKSATLMKAEEKIHSKAHKVLLISPLDDGLFPAFTVNSSNTEAVQGLKAAESLTKGDVAPSTGGAETPSVEPIGTDTLPDETDTDTETETAAKCLSVESLSAQSSNKYDTIRTDVGDLVYTDRALRWTYLPPQLRQQLSVRTPCDDEMVRAKQLLRFSVTGPSLVLLLMDMRSSKPPSWVESDGYSKMSDQAIARLAVKGVLYETYYGMHGKYVREGEVVLGGNWSSEMHCMYSVFVVPVPVSMSNSYFDRSQTSPSDLVGKDPVSSSLEDCAAHSDLQRLFDEATYDSSYKRVDVNNCWVDGGNGVALFHSDDDHVTVGVQGCAWSDEFKIDMNSSPHTGSFESVDYESMRAYQLSYSLGYMPGLFIGTQTLTITPRYCIVNCLTEAVMVAQRGAFEVLEIAPYRAEGWHKSRAFLGTTVQLRTESSVWSMGTVDLNEFGRSVVHLPCWGIGHTDPPLVICVEVKVAEPADNCSVVVVIWQAAVETSTALSIRNDSDVHITVSQADIDTRLSIGGLFDVCVGPSVCVPFGWADPDGSDDILVTAGTCMAGAVRVARINFLKAGHAMCLSDNSGREGAVGRLVLSVVAEGGGRVLRVTRSSVAVDLSAVTSSKTIDSEGREVKEDIKSFGLSFNLASFGLSLVVEKPVRREFLSLYIDGLEGRVKTKGAMRSFEFVVSDLQVDNYSETAVYPVLLHSLKNNKMDSMSHRRTSGSNLKDSESPLGLGGDNGTGDVPLLQISLIEQRIASSSTLKYVAVRLMPLALELDSATLQLLQADLLTDLKYVEKDHIQALVTPDRWIEEFNLRYMSPSDRMTLVSVHRSRVCAQASQMYIEKLILHPMKLILTFVQTPFPRKSLNKATFQTTAFNFLTSLAGVDRMQLKLKSFEVEDVLESRSSLVGRIRHKTLQDLQSQLAQIAGSLTVIGSPMGFARKVGSGVKSFFYEPYQGAVLGPHDFIRGLQKGTHHLITNVVSGAMTSTAGIVGSASKGLGFLSGDAEYVRKRSLKNQQDRASRGGIIDGLMDGGESVVSGITSGVTGLVTKPYEEARKNGVQGFFKGVGLGIMGAALKPVMGVTDGLTSVVSGISNQVDKVCVYVLVRPTRAFERSASDARDLVLVSLDLEAAFAQEFVKKRALTNSYLDSFLCYISSEVTGDSFILSETFLFWRQPKNLWGRCWSNISHIFFMPDAVGVVLYGEAHAVCIPCGTEKCAMKVYGALASNAHRMGYPSNVIPLSVIMEQQTLPKEKREDIVNKRVLAASQAGVMDNYRFGSANNPSMKKVGGVESAVLRRTENAVLAGFATWALLDEAVWRLIGDWDCSHVALQASRCCATLIINKSRSPVQVPRVQVLSGRNFLLLGSAAMGYETDSRVIMPGGCTLVFAWAFPPTPLDTGHVTVSINTSAFAATVGSMQRDSVCEERGGFTVGFLEKTVSDWWSKYVILVT